MQGLKVRVWGASETGPVEAYLPAYALWPLATDVAYRCLPLCHDLVPDELLVEVAPAFTRRSPEKAVALVCSVFAPGQSDAIATRTYAVTTTECLHGAARDLWLATYSEGQRFLSFEILTTDPDAADELSVEAPGLRHVRPLLEESYAVGQPLLQNPIVVLEGAVAEAIEAFYEGRSTEAMCALHGTVNFCPELRSLWLHITSVVALEEAVSGPAQVVVDPSSLAPVIKASRDARLLGLVHNHLITDVNALRCATPSVVDVDMMRHVLYRAHQVSLTVNVARDGDGELSGLAYYHLAWHQGNIVTAAGFAVHAPDKVGSSAEPLSSAKEDVSNA